MILYPLTIQPKGKPFGINYCYHIIHYYKLTRSSVKSLFFAYVFSTFSIIIVGSSSIVTLLMWLHNIGHHEYFCNVLAVMFVLKLLHKECWRCAWLFFTNLCNVCESNILRIKEDAYMATATYNSPSIKQDKYCSWKLPHGCMRTYISNIRYVST